MLESGWHCHARETSELVVFLPTMAVLVGSTPPWAVIIDGSTPIISIKTIVTTTTIIIATAAASVGCLRLGRFHRKHVS